MHTSLIIFIGYYYIISICCAVEIHMHYCKYLHACELKYIICIARTLDVLCKNQGRRSLNLSGGAQRGFTKNTWSVYMKHRLGPGRERLQSRYPRNFCNKTFYTPDVYVARYADTATASNCFLRPFETLFLIFNFKPVGNYTLGFLPNNRYSRDAFKNTLF